MNQQYELIATARSPQQVPDEVVHRQPSLLAAIRLAVQASGLDEKQVFIPLKVDKASWSKIMSGQFNFPTNKYCEFMELVGNDIPLRWLAFKRGYKLERLLSDVEAENASLRAELEEAKKEMAIVRKWLKGTKG